MSVCTTDSASGNPPTYIDSAPCGRYDHMATRRRSDGTPVDVVYMTHAPTGTAKAVAVLLCGGNGDAAIVQDPSNPHKVAHAGMNFVVRSAALFAEKGYLAITIDRPSDQMVPDYASFAAYRITQLHAVDIIAVVQKVNTGNLPVFLVGTSAGTISAIAQNRIASASMLSSAMTIDVPGDPLRDLHGYVLGNGSAYSGLLSSNVVVSVQVLADHDDQCPNSAPSGAKQLHDQLVAAGVVSHHLVIDPPNGFVVDSDPCQATTYHGFLGGEREAVQHIVHRMNLIVSAGQGSPGAWPVASPGRLVANASGMATVDLATLASGSGLGFDLAHPKTILGAALALNGTRVTYHATGFLPGGNDAFVYVASDTYGRRAAAIVTV